MGNSPTRLLASLNGNANYRRLFRDAFPKDQGSITEQQVFTALTAFETSLVSLNSRYDRYVHGSESALSSRELEGLNVFRSFVARCSECHTPPLFTNEQIAVIGMPEPAGREFDVGAEKTLGTPKVKGGFKVPTLRNITRTAPYSHSGAFTDLRSAVEFYNKGRGNAVPAGMHLYLHWHISDPHLSDSEVDRIVDFLGALTDETLLPQTPARVPSGLVPAKRGEGR
jgi:cytochrome c peroxidase